MLYENALCTMLYETKSTQWLSWFNNQSLFLYGNHVQPLRLHLQTLYRRGNLARDQRNHSEAMSEVRYERPLNNFLVK